MKVNQVEGNEGKEFYCWKDYSRCINGVCINGPASIHALMK